jgi:hypothetical protein
MQLQGSHSHATNPASTTKIGISTSGIPLQPIRVISNPPRRNASWVLCPALARMFKELAALRVLHGFPKLLYFRVGHQGSLTELLEEYFSCFSVLVHLTHGFGCGGTHGTLAWWLGMRQDLGSLNEVVGAVSCESSTKQSKGLHT